MPWFKATVQVVVTYETLVEADDYESAHKAVGYGFDPTAHKEVDCETRVYDLTPTESALPTIHKNDYPALVDEIKRLMEHDIPHEGTFTQINIRDDKFEVEFTRNEDIAYVYNMYNSMIERTSTPIGAVNLSNFFVTMD